MYSQFNTGVQLEKKLPALGGTRRAAGNRASKSINTFRLHREVAEEAWEEHPAAMARSKALRQEGALCGRRSCRQSPRSVP